MIVSDKSHTQVRVVIQMVMAFDSSTLTQTIHKREMQVTNEHTEHQFDLTSNWRNE